MNEEFSAGFKTTTSWTICKLNFQIGPTLILLV